MKTNVASPYPSFESDSFVRRNIKGDNTRRTRSNATLMPLPLFKSAGLADLLELDEFSREAAATGVDDTALVMAVFQNPPSHQGS